MPNLPEILWDIPFVVVGAMAARLYMPERTTFDTDILVLEEDRAACEQRLTEAGAQRIGDLSIGGSTWQLPDGSELDVIVSDEEWAHEAVSNPVVPDTGVPTISLPYLIVMKLLSGRAQDIADMTRMLGGADKATLEEVYRVVRRYIPDAVEDVESMVALGRLEYDADRRR